MSVNAPKAVYERRVQNGGLCVNPCMDNADVVDAAEQIAGKEKKKKKKDKVRSAWISFAGRIVAQLVGAIATVALGVMVLHRYTSTNTRPPVGTPPAAIGQAASPPVHVVVVTPAMLGLRDSCAPALNASAERFPISLVNGR